MQSAFAVLRSSVLIFNFCQICQSNPSQVKLSQVMFRLPFLEDTTPPPFYQATISAAKRRKLDQWFIGHRSQAYYLKRFDEFDRAGKLHARWHWAAFFMTFGWLLYRKRYLDCVVYCVAGWSFIKVNIAIILAVSEFVLIGHLPDAWQAMARVGIGLLVWLFWAGMVARWADAYYYRMARREIADALELYPDDDEAQRAHLQHEGGVSLVGLSVAFVIFGILLSVIATVFVPMYAKHQEQQVLHEVYTEASAIAKQVDVVMASTGQCPTDRQVMSSTHRAEIHITKAPAGIHTDCAVVARITGVYYPIRYLNGRTLTIYQDKSSDGTVLWRCQSSLSKKQSPKHCLD